MVNCYIKRETVRIGVCCYGRHGAGSGYSREGIDREWRPECNGSAIEEI